jgi:bacterioferritin-associated ferredoxin
MIVCLCEGVSEREIRGVIARGARCVESIRRACGAGAGCGTCRETLEDMLDEHAQKAVASSDKTQEASQRAA